MRYERVHSVLRRRKDLVIADSDKLTEEKILGARGCVSNDRPSERVHWSRYFYTNEKEYNRLKLWHQHQLTKWNFFLLLRRRWQHPVNE